MAANAMMSVLKSMQRDLADQKEYTRNLHAIHRNINEKFKLMADKFDLQQATMERLEQQVRKNHTLLFGDESPIHFEDETASCYVPQYGGKGDVETSEKHMENNEVNQLMTVSKEALNDMEWTGACDNQMNDGSKKSGSEDNVRELTSISNEIKAIKELIAELRTGTIVEETGSVKNEARVTPNHFSTELICQLNGDLKQIIFDINEIKGFIKDTVATQKTLVGDTASQESASSYSSTECIRGISADLKQMISEVSDMKELIGQNVSTKKTSVDETAILKKKTVQISPTYFTAEQISKLNSELKQLMQTYQATNILPNIEVVSKTSPADEHPVMKALRAGVYFEPKNNTLSEYKESYGIRLGIRGFKRSKVQDLLTNYPDLTMYDVIRHGLQSINEWNELSKIYDFTCSHSEPKRMWTMETVEISPTYFEAAQLSKLNAELRQITKKYSKTNIFPNVVVRPNTRNFDDHPVMRFLRRGVIYKNSYRKQDGVLVLNHDQAGLWTADIQKLLRHNPHLCLYEVIKKRLESCGKNDLNNFFTTLYVKIQASNDYFL